MTYTSFSFSQGYRGYQSGPVKLEATYSRSAGIFMKSFAKKRHEQVDPLHFVESVNLNQDGTEERAWAKERLAVVSERKLNRKNLFRDLPRRSEC